MFDNTLAMESAFELIFQSSYLCYTYELSIIKLILRILTATISQKYWLLIKYSTNIASLNGNIFIKHTI